MQQTGPAAGSDQTTLDETEPKVVAASAGAASDETEPKVIAAGVEVSEAVASVGPRSSPAPSDRSYDNVRESVVYEEVL